MKALTRTLILAIIICFTALSAVSIDAAGPTTVQVLSDGTGDNVNVRTDPNMQAQVIRTARPGDTLQVNSNATINADGFRWWQVVSDHGGVAYIRADLVSTPSSAVTQANPVMTQQMTVATWSNTYGDTLTPIASDLYAISDAATTESFPAMGAACQRLNTDLGPALAAPPIPDATANGHWQRALADLSKAADDCQAAATFHDYGLLSSAGTWFESASTELVSLKSALMPYR